MPLKVSKPKKEVPIEEVVREYVALRDESTRIKNRMSTLSTTIKAYAEKNGTKSDTGSYYVEDENFLFGKQAKKSVSFKTEEAIEFFKRKGLTSCIETVERIVEEAVERCINSGDITFDELESITETKVSYAVDVKVKEAMPEVEETTVALAASSKPIRKIKGGK